MDISFAVFTGTFVVAVFVVAVLLEDSVLRVEPRVNTYGRFLAWCALVTFLSNPFYLPVTLYKMAYGDDVGLLWDAEIYSRAIRWVPQYIKGFDHGRYVRAQPRLEWLRTHATNVCDGGCTHIYCPHCADKVASARYVEARCR